MSAGGRDLGLAAVPVVMTESSACCYQCGMCCGDCISTENFLNLNNCKCNCVNCIGVLGSVSLCTSFGMMMFGLIFLCCDRGRASQRMGSCMYLWWTVAPSIFTFLMALSNASIGTTLFLIVGMCVIWKKYGPRFCRGCRCNNFAHGLERVI